MVRLTIVVAISILLVGCSGQQTPQPTTPTPSDQVNAAPKVTVNGCTIDLKKICQVFIDQPHFLMNGEDFTWQAFAENQPPHTDFVLPAIGLNKDLGGAARCFLTVHNRKVTAAELLPQPTIEKTVEYFKQNGWCEEQSPDYDKLMTATLQKITLGN